jgi:hypothetical protein
MSAHQEPQGNTSKFNIEWSPMTKTAETIKWTINMKFIMVSAQDLSYMILFLTALWSFIKLIDKLVRAITRSSSCINKCCPEPSLSLWLGVVTKYNREHKDKLKTLATFAKTLMAFLHVTALKMINTSWLV